MNRSNTALPFDSPRWLTPSRVALASVTVFAIAATIPSIWWIPDARHEIESRRAALAAVIATTTLLSLLLAKKALSARSIDRTALTCVFGAIPLGILNAGLSLSAVQLVARGDPGQALGGFILGVLIGGFYGAPLGLVFGSAYAIVVTSARRALDAPSHDGVDRVLFTSCSWIAVTGAALASYNTDSPMPLPPWSLIAAGAAGAALFRARLALRARWLRRVVEGRELAFRVEHADDVVSSSALLPVVRPGKMKPDSVVARRPPPLGVAYRETPHWTPVALAEAPLDGNAHR